MALPSFDDLPETPVQAPQAAPMSFDDLPDHAPASGPAPAPKGGMSFDSLPDHSQPVPSPAAPRSNGNGQVRVLSPVAQQYLQNHPATSFSLDAAPIANDQLAKAGTLGTAIDNSDKGREAEQLKNSAMGFFNARIRQYFLDPEFLHLPKEEQDHILNAQIEQWENTGLPAGKYNAVNPDAFKGLPGEVSPREAWTTYANDIRTQGIAQAQAPGAIFKDDGKLVLAKAPTMLGSETLGAAGVSGARAIPGIFGGNLAGEAGAALGESLAGTPGAIIGGIGGSIAGAFGADKALTEYANRSDNEAFRNGLQSLDDAVQMGEQEHPIASAIGRAGAQAAQNRTGLLDLIAGKGLTHALAPRLTGGLIGGGVEAGSELGRGDDFDPYKIGEAALSGSVFSKPRYIGEGPVPMSYEGRHWADTNTPAPELYSHVDSMLRNGAAPADVFKSMGNSLPDTPENRRALRVVSADIRHGRDPAQSMEQVNFRPNGLSVDQTVAAINEHTKDWVDAPKVHVHDSYDSDSIPENMKDHVGPGTLGWKADDGSIHIVASQHLDPAAVTATMYHEGMHAGLARAYQDGLEDRLVQLYDGANPRLRKALDQSEAELSQSRPDWKDMTEDQRKALATDEVLAGTAENGVHKAEFDKIKSYIMNFGRTRLGELGSKLKYSDAEVRQIMTTGHDAVSKGEGSTAGPTRFMNFGIGSETADHASLYSQQRLGGVPNEPEYPQGWFKAPADGQPRYEVSDKDAQFASDEQGLSPAERMGRPGARLGDVLHHPTLFEAYPHLRDIEVKANNSKQYNGSWSPKDNRITLSMAAENPMGTLLHEVQHAIQEHEGWATGANPDAVYRNAPIEAVHTALTEQLHKVTERADNAAAQYQSLVEASKNPEWQQLRHLHDEYRRFEDAKTGATREEDAVLLERAAREAYKKYTEASDELRKKITDNPWDTDFSDLKYKMAQSDHPIEWHLKNAQEDYERNHSKQETISEALHGDEWAKRAEARKHYEVSENLYDRSQGEYEARATTDRRSMTEEERFDNPQFAKMDRTGTHPNQLYKPLEVVDAASQELVNKPPMRANDDEKSFDELPDQTPRAQSEPLDHPEGKKPNNTIPNPDSIDWSKTRFSRKYSGSFPHTYEGRRERTEDIIHGRYGVYENLKGMMRPLEQYNRMSEEDIKDSAQSLIDQGLNPEIAVAQGAIPDHSGWIVAMDHLVRDSLNEAEEVAGRYRSTGGMRHERELMASVTKVGQLLSVFDKSASNLGRTMYALQLRLGSIREGNEEGLNRLLNSIRFANGKLDKEQLDQIAQAFLTKNPTDIRKAIDKFDPNWKKYGQSLFYNFILGSKSVQLGNIMGNATHIAQRGLGDIIGYGVGLGQEGAFRAGDKLGLDVSAPDRMHSDELMNRMSGLLAGLMNKETYNSHRAFNTAAKEFFVKAGENEHENKFASQAIPNLPLSIGLEYGTRGLQAADAFFRTVIEHSAMQGLATREARRLNNGERPSVEQIADVMASPTREMLSKVKAEADRLVFQEDPPKQAEWFGKIMRSVPGGWLLAPIIRTPANIGRTAFETFDPSGRITQRNRDALKAGGPEANRVRGNQILAAALWAGALYLIKNDMLNGGGPANPQARAQWLMSHQPYSIGSAEDGFFPLRGISPIGDGLSMIADIKGAAKYGTDPDTSGADKALMIASAMTDAYLSNSFLSPVTDGLQRGAKPTIQNLLGTLVQSAASIPVVSQYKKEKDPFVRDTSNEGSLAPSMADKASLMDDPLMEHYFQSVKPRASLPVRRDPFGDPVMADNPTSVDPVAREVGRLVESTGKAVMPSFSRVIKGTHVPNDMYNSFLTIAGPAMHQVITEVMQSPEYKKTLDDEQRAALLRNASKVKGLHARLNAQLAQMMLDRDPSFEDKFIPKDLKTISQIPGEN